MKTKSLFLTGLCLGALAFSAAPAAFGQTTATTNSATASASPMESTTPARRGVPYHGKISAVDSTAKTFTLTTKKGESRTYKMMENTKFMKDGKPATMADVTADQEVRGQCLKQADGTMEAKSVMLGVNPNKGKGRHSKKKMEMEEASPSPSATP